ncbi:HAD family hydrolase [Hydrogenovibrio halophilus]|uniref:HAD family hydrolase n=1 Tax=Hydrogenovibrio halophilus TaxID=373391 RepID=UPI00035D3D80|nr:HAD-IA family hydrolase [Hydrogenovibrio halophilus]
MMSIDCVLFDLDGTLLDTSYDFAYALNQTCRHYGVQPLHYQTIRKTVSQGGLAMTELAFPNLSDAEIQERREHFLDVYHRHIACHTQLFPGLEAGLKHLADKRVPWGIVTNKPTWLTEKLLSIIKFPSEPLGLVCGDTLAIKKPHPEPMWLAAEQCGAMPKNCLYLGDHPRDIEAGVNAGMQTGAALFGYLPEGAGDDAWPADFHFETPIEITHFLQERL